jgi:hypothetical protein
MHSNMRNFTAAYVYREFPKWVELANGERIIVNNADEEAAAVGTEQDETPAREALMAEARSLGLNPHHRTGEEKLAQMIKEARGE